MFRVLLVCAPLLIVAAQPPALAADGSGEQSATAKCEKKKKKRGGGLFGAVAGNIAGSALGAAGIPTGVAGLAFPVGSLISEGIARLLDCKEQVQAAKATEEATRGGVGTTASWESQSRPGVSGSSTVTGQTASADGGSCMTVSDVVIVNGEETTVPKRMCRAPGASGYTLAA
jgi:hypothetical protein